MASVSPASFSSSVEVQQPSVEKNAQNPRVISFSLQAKEEVPNVELIAERIKELISTVGYEMYDTHKDPFSSLVFKWASWVVNAKIIKKPIDDESREQIGKCLRVLKSFFVDTLLNVELTDPILVKPMNWICERSFIENAALPEVELIPHKFAKLLLIELEPIELFKSKVNYDNTCYQFYAGTAHHAFMQYQFENFNEHAPKESEKFKELLEVIEKRNKARVERVRKEIEGKIGALKEKLAADKKESQEDVAAKQAECDILRQDMERLRTELLALKIMVLVQESEMAAIRRQNILNLKELERLRNRIDDNDDGFCTIS